MIEEARHGVLKAAAPKPGWDPGFRIGDVVRMVGGGGAYDRGEVLEVAEERYYKVDYGLRFSSLIREENLEPFDENNPLSDLPRSFVPPILPPLARVLRWLPDGL